MCACCCVQDRDPPSFTVNGFHSPTFPTCTPIRHLDWTTVLTISGNVTWGAHANCCRFSAQHCHQAHKAQPPGREARARNGACSMCKAFPPSYRSGHGVTVLVTARYRSCAPTSHMQWLHLQTAKQLFCDYALVLFAAAQDPCPDPHGLRHGVSRLWRSVRKARR
jgi:hypothetical protein